MGRATLLLGNLLCSRHESRRNPTDLDDAISAFQKALESWRERPELGLVPEQLLVGAPRQVRTIGDATDLDEALRASEDALRHAGFVRSRHVPEQPRGPPADAGRAVRQRSGPDTCHQVDRGSARTGVRGYAGIGGYCGQPGACLEMVYERYGRASDLEQATKSYRTACLRARSHQLGMTMDASVRGRCRRCGECGGVRRWRHPLSGGGFRAALRRATSCAGPWGGSARARHCDERAALARDGQLVAAAQARDGGRQLTRVCGPAAAFVLETSSSLLLKW